MIPLRNGARARSFAAGCELRDRAASRSRASAASGAFGASARNAQYAAVASSVAPTASCARELVREIGCRRVERGRLAQLIARCRAIAEDRRLLRALRELSRLSSLRGGHGLRRRRRGTRRPLRDRRHPALQRGPALRVHDRRGEGCCEQQEYCPRSSRHGETVRVAEPLLPKIVALIVALCVGDTLLLPFAVVVAEELSPVDVVPVVGDTVASPEANHDTSCP